MRIAVLKQQGVKFIHTRYTLKHFNPTLYFIFFVSRLPYVLRCFISSFESRARHLSQRQD